MPLPSHERRRSGFRDIFERSAEDTIRAMNQSGSDVASQKPQHKLKLENVGVSRRSIPVRIANPLGGDEPAHLACDLTVHVGLDGERRGIHVSRLGDAIARLTNEVYGSLADYAGRLAEVVARTQQASTAHVRVRGAFSYLEAFQGVKEKTSLESLLLLGEAEVHNKVTTTSTGIQFNHMTACPCVQETLRHSYGDSATKLLSQIEQHQMPFLTHSQRCTTSILIRGATQSPTLTKLLDHIDTVVVRCVNTMPRELELLTVFEAHKKAQFLEDVMRDLLVAMRHLLKNSDLQTRVKIHSISNESIHDFDLDGDVEYSLAELDQLLAKS